MVTGTQLVVSGGFSSLVNIGTDRWPIQLYAALLALIINLVDATALTPILRRYDFSGRLDPTATDLKPPTGGAT